MKTETKAEKAERLMAESRKERGYLFDEWAFMCREDPDFFEAYNNLYKASLGEQKALDIKVKEFVAIALLSHRGVGIGAIVAHMQRAMKHGATKEEILEVIESTICAGGAPTFHHGLKALLALEESKPTT